MTPTKRQTQIIELLAQGNTAEQVADSMQRSVATVRHHIVLACERLDARNTAHLVAKALSNGWIKSLCLALALTTVMDTGTDKMRVTARVRVMRPNYSRLEA